MTEVFADTWYFLALVGSDDAGNARAAAASREARRRGSLLVTTAWVLTEVGDALAHPVARPAFPRLEQFTRECSRMPQTSPAHPRR